MAEEKFDVLSPAGEPGAKWESAAASVEDLNDKTICQVSNGMFQADVVLAAVGELIKKRFPRAKIVPYTEFPLIEALSDVGKRLKDLSALLRQKGADAVISSTGA